MVKSVIIQNKESSVPQPFPEEWIKAFTEEELERLATMTVDGGLTDTEALVKSGLRSKLYPPKQEDLGL